MAQLETRYYKLEKLVKSEYIDEVNEMLMNGVSPHTVTKWLKDRGFTISHPKLYEYKEMLQTAITKRITVERLLGIGVPKRTPIQLQALGLASAKNMVRNEMEVLDNIIQLGMSALTANPTIRLQDAMRAIELKTKLTGGAHGGLTQYGLDQLRELESSKFDAIIKVVLQYLPEERHKELETAIQEAEYSFYKEQAPEYLEEYEKQLAEQKAMEQEAELQQTLEDTIGALTNEGSDIDEERDTEVH
jgi:hypothetical protein